MVTVAREHFATVLGGLENMGDGEPSDSKGSKTILFTPKSDRRRDQNLWLECKFVSKIFLKIFCFSSFIIRNDPLSVIQ